MMNANGQTREEFLAGLPVMESWVVGMENLWGAFQRCASLKISADRIIMMVRFEKIYHVNFYNPANPKEDQERSINLSSEALLGVAGLAYVLTGESEWAKQWKAMMQAIIQHNPVTKAEGSNS